MTTSRYYRLLDADRKQNVRQEILAAFQVYIYFMNLPSPRVYILFRPLRSLCWGRAFFRFSHRHHRPRSEAIQYARDVHSKISSVNVRITGRTVAYVRSLVAFSSRIFSHNQPKDILHSDRELLFDFEPAYSEHAGHIDKLNNNKKLW